MTATFGLAQHTYIILHKSDGSERILRGGPEPDNLIIGDLKVVNEKI